MTANIIRTVSNLLSEDARPAWLDLKKPLRMKMVNNMLLALEEVAFLLAEVTENPELLEESAENLRKSIKNSSKFVYDIMSFYSAGHIGFGYQDY